MNITVELFAVALALGAYLYFRWRKSMRYFEDRGIPFVKPIWPLGSDVKGSLLMKHISYSLEDMYHQLEPHKVGGIFRGTAPTIIVRDPEYVNRIYTTDFAHFVDRFREREFTSSILEQHLFLLTGNKWRFLRGKLSPVFTSGKLKWMSEEMNKCSESFIQHLSKSAPLGEDFDLKGEISGFTIQVIGSCAFGIETNSIGNPDAKFRKFANEVFPTDPISVFKQIVRDLTPNLFKVLGVRSVAASVENFVLDIVRQSLHHRKTTGYKRNDFIQLILELKEKGSVDLDGLEKDEEDEKEIQTHSNYTVQNLVEMDDELLSAQVFLFLVAGYETTASTIHHLIYLFSQNLDCQEKARQLVKAGLAKHGDYSYDMIKELTYLNDCIDETLRLFPPLSFNFRVCTKDYTFPNGIKIEKNTPLVLPTYAIQRDPKIFPEPDKFIPGRISKAAKGSFSPFGDGPRICIGKRFAQLEINFAVARILNTFQINPSDQKVVIDFQSTSFLLSNKMGLPVQLKKLSK